MLHINNCVGGNVGIGTHNVFAAGYPVVTAYTVDAVPRVSGGVMCQGRLCCRSSVSRGWRDREEEMFNLLAPEFFKFFSTPCM
jgi:hypothetical protein